MVQLWITEAGSVLGGWPLHPGLHSEKLPVETFTPTYTPVRRGLTQGRLMAG